MVRERWQSILNGLQSSLVFHSFLGAHKGRCMYKTCTCYSGNIKRNDYVTMTLKHMRDTQRWAPQPIGFFVISEIKEFIVFSSWKGSNLILNPQHWLSIIIWFCLVLSPNFYFDWLKFLKFSFLINWTCNTSSTVQSDLDHRILWIRLVQLLILIVMTLLKSEGAGYQRTNQTIRFGFNTCYVAIILGCHRSQTSTVYPQ